MKYPEVFDIEIIEDWVQSFLTKEVRSEEWDLMVTEELPDVFSIPFFTTEFCDKFVSNIKELKYHQFNRWGTPTDVISLDRLELMDLSLHLVTNYLWQICQHFWRVNGKKWEEMNIDPQVLRFSPDQDLRLHHDFCNITMTCLLDDESEGGELVFPKYGTLKMKQGRFYIFPGQITHRYGMRKIKYKNRYLLNIYCYAS